MIFFKVIGQQIPVAVSETDSEAVQNPRFPYSQSPGYFTYQLAKDLYTSCQSLKVPYYVNDQFMRAALSVCLNLSEGSAKPTMKDRRKFYFIALGSLREVQTCLELHGTEELKLKADTVAAHCYRLCYSLGSP